jgi:hypothetical protein
MHSLKTWCFGDTALCQQGQEAFSSDLTFTACLAAVKFPGYGVSCSQSLIM